MKHQVAFGLENFLSSPQDSVKGKRFGLLCNPASVDGNLNHAAHLIHACFPGQLTALFSPQHGFYAEKQDNMIESTHFMEPRLQIPVYSLYHKSRIPTADMFDGIDILLVDIQDVGTRVYTFIYTISYCLEAAAALGKKVIVLDRPNPIGGNQVEGNVLSTDCTSFVGRFPIPMRHGLTVGEMSQFINQEFQIGCDLDVIPMRGWKRRMYWQDTGRLWIAPSPNLPTPQSCMVYPGQVIFEGTNISEGRGTTLPFEQFGAPFLDVQTIKANADKWITGAILRPVNFEPTSGKWSGHVCHGFQIHVTSRKEFFPYITSLRLLQLICRSHSDAFQFKAPPYEYEFERMPIDLILGSQTLRENLLNQQSLTELSGQWQDAVNRYLLISRKHHLY